ncbi:unnamed protein product, partial [marine sediment metagenome]
ALVKKKVGHQLCLMGNIDIAHVLTYGTKEEVFDAVKFATFQKNISFSII